MASRISTGDYVAQIFAYEPDVLRLLRDVQVFVHEGNALYAAVFLCRYSGQPSVVERSAISAPWSRAQPTDLDQSIWITPQVPTTDTTHHYQLRGDLLLILLHIDTTWRFDSFESRAASPNLSWPATRGFFAPKTYLEDDLILKEQYFDSDACRVPPPAAHLLHVEIFCNTEADATVREIAQKLRTDLLYWTRQLLFELDPAQTKAPSDGIKYILMLEVDARHTAETLASNLNAESLRHLSGPSIDQALVRIFSLEGSATYHNTTPADPDELPIDNRTHSQAVLEDSGQAQPESETNFGLRPGSHVHK